jgi:hypothetical protein
MPYKTWGCKICGAQAPKALREHGNFAERMKWLREHYKLHHPAEFERMMRKAVKTRKRRRREK